jgi:hypothetical protein
MRKTVRESMRRGLLFLLAIGLVLAGLVGGAGMMIWLGMYLLWDDFLRPLFKRSS